MRLIRNILKLFTPKQEEDDELNLVRLGDELKHADMDYKFAQLFSHSGGIFSYCVDEAEALGILNQIIKNEDLKSVFCCDEDLKNFLSVLNVPQSTELTLNNDAALITCEYLIAHNGSIMLSYNNILHYHSSRLPKKVIIMANVSQIVPDLNMAMMKIKRRKTMLKNLTSISGSQSKLGGTEANHTKLFLLLLED
ncbi:LUD domain-containing protein [Bergeyella cardium]|nr:LUD domain-containing protein [Bergeyella cardium]WHE34469.1 LUD domain-containing protein [Bergeyella cardium]WHF61120.1 LUD domain-containing protein [Bergeyella cardium]